MHRIHRKKPSNHSGQATASQVSKAVSIIFHYFKGSVGREEIIIEIGSYRNCVVTGCNIGVGTP